MCKIACRTYVLSEPEPRLARVRTRNDISREGAPTARLGFAAPRLAETRQRILGAIDLAIDFATLGEYGLEPLPAPAAHAADGTCRERPGHARRKSSGASLEGACMTGWEAFATGRRGSCGRADRAPLDTAARERR